VSLQVRYTRKTGNQKGIITLINELTKGYDNAKTYSMLEIYYQFNRINPKTTLPSKEQEI